MIYKKYYVYERLLDLNIIFTNKDYGNVMTMDKEKFSKDFDLSDKIIISSYQTHSDNIKIIEDTKNTYFEDTDGFITNLKNVAFFTKYADCLPIYLYDKNKKIFGVVHSGWQGTYKEIGKKAINMMINHYKSNIKDIIIILGINIGAKNYEVQKDFYEKFKNKFHDEKLLSSFIFENDKIFFDNKKFNIENFKKLKIDEKNIIDNNYCTYTQNFHSYRRDKKSSGRNGSFIYLDNI